MLAQQFGTLQATAVRRDQLQPGDLLFFYTPVSHVGIYLGSGKMARQHLRPAGQDQPHRRSAIAQRPPHLAIIAPAPATG